MTLRDAYDAGMKCLPVVYDGLRYKRITRCGYSFGENGSVIPYAELLSYTDKSLTVAKCETVELFNTEETNAGISQER